MYRRSVAAGGALCPKLEADLAQLPVVDRGWRAGQGVSAGGGLREGDHVADRVGACQPLHDAVEAVGDPAVRRRSVAERLEQEAEAGLGLGRIDSRRGEDPALCLGVADTDRTAAHLLPVPDEVIGMGPCPTRALRVEVAARR